MAIRFGKDKIILYLVIISVFLAHWIHNDVSVYPGSFLRSLVNNSWQLLYVMCMNLLYFEWILPALSAGKTGRVFSIVASLLLYLCVFMAGLYACWEIGKFIQVYQPFPSRDYNNAGEAFEKIGRVTPGAFILFAVFKLFFDYTQLRYEGQQVKLEKKQAELLYLKSQINPHFLFNTLNNIYSLSQYQPQLVSESVLRLSKLLRYLLYEASHELISIEKEIRILNDYIDLEKLRYDDRVAISFTHDIDDFSEAMPALMLLPLVENAFKHGISTSRGKRFVEVHCTLRKKQLHFVVSNTSHAGAAQHTEKDHIGLPNLRRRLYLLYKDFELLTEHKDGSFTASLTIDLASNV